MTEIFQTGLAGERVIPDEARAALVIVHGLGEHRGRYRAVAQRLGGAGIACFTYDQRGHGESPGPRTHIGTFADFTADLSRVVAGVREACPAWPVFLWGHSLGSIVVLGYALQHPDGIRGGISSGCPLAAMPAVASTFSKAGTLLCDILPTIRVDSRLDPVLLSHREDVQQAYRDDPLVTKTVTLKLVFELSLAIKRIKQQAHGICTPWLAVHGSEDGIAPVAGSRQLIDALGSRDKQLVIIEAARHEVQNEVPAQRDRFLALVADWIHARAGRDTAGVAAPHGTQAG